jgi:DNA-directed RNA polymerase delta subunit
MLENLFIDNNNMGIIQSTGETFQMNETAKEIVELLKQGLDKDAIVSELAKKYNQKEEEVFIDVSDFLTKLKIYGLIK